MKSFLIRFDYKNLPYTATVHPHEGYFLVYFANELVNLYGGQHRFESDFTYSPGYKTASPELQKAIVKELKKHKD